MFYSKNNEVAQTPYENSYKLDNLGTSLSQVCSAVARETFEDTPENLAKRIYLGYKHKRGEKLSREEFDEQYGSTGLEHDPNMTKEFADYLLEIKERRDRNNYIISQGRGGVVEGMGKFGTSFLTSFASPINIATAFIPVFPKTTLIGAAKFGTGVARVGQGVAAGALTQAALEPALSAAYKIEQEDYSSENSFSNIAVAGAFGGAVGAVVQGVSRFKSKFSKGEIKSSSPYLNQELQNTVAKQLEKTEPSFTPIGEIELSKEWMKKAITLEHPLSEAKTTQQIKHLLSVKERIIKESGEKKFFDRLCKEPSLKEKASTKAKVALEDLANVDLVLENRVAELQRYHGFKGCPDKAFLAEHQFNEGNHINLENSLTPESIYEKSIEQRENYIRTQPQEHAKVMDAKSYEKKAKMLREKAHHENLSAIAKYEKAPHIGLQEMVINKIDTRKSTVKNFLTGGLTHDLEKANLTAVFKNKNFQNDIARELGNLLLPVEKHINTSSSGAKAVAKIIHKWQGKAVEQANLAGANIAQLEGYITKQTHNARQIRKMGREGWKHFICPLLKENLGDTALDEIYNSLVTGLHGFGEELSSFSCKSSMAAKASSMRKLHFKDANAWLIYNEKCGNYALKDSILSNLSRLGEITGIMEILGPNPEIGFKNIKDKLLENLRSNASDPSTPSLIRQIQSKRFDNQLSLLLGNGPPDNPTFAALCSNARGFINLCTLGRVVLSSIPDMAAWVATSQNNGIPVLKSYGNLISKIASSFSNRAEKKEVARLIGVWSENILGGVYCRLNSDGLGTGAMQRAQNTFFKLNFMEFWDKSFKESCSLTLSSHLAHQKDWNKFPQYLKNALEKNRIGKDEFGLLKHCIQTMDSGTKYMLPDSKGIPIDVLDKYLAKKKLPITNEARLKVKSELELNFKDYFSSQANLAIPTPGIRERSIVTQGSQAGSVMGEVWRFFFQFKSFPIAFVSKSMKAATIDHLPMQIRKGFLGDMQKSLNPSRLAAFSQLFAATSMLGGITLIAKKLSKEPDKGLKDFEFDKKFVVESITQGGGLGIFGDFIFSEYDRYGATFTQQLVGGPFACDANNAASIASNILKGEHDKALKTAKKWGKMRIPFANLFYLQHLLNKTCF